METNVDKSKEYFAISDKESVFLPSGCKTGIVKNPVFVKERDMWVNYNMKYWFADIENIWRYAGRGDYIAKIYIPKKTKVFQDACKTCYTSNKFYISDIMTIEDFLKEYREQINYEFSFDIAAFLYDYFDLWWDADKFDYKEGSVPLASHCRGHFEKWWNPDKFNWIRASNGLAKNCGIYFEKWWNPEKFNWAAIKYLYSNCQDYRDIWEKDKERLKYKLIDVYFWYTHSYPNAPPDEISYYILDLLNEFKVLHKITGIPSRIWFSYKFKIRMRGMDDFDAWILRVVEDFEEYLTFFWDGASPMAGI